MSASELVGFFLEFPLRPRAALAPFQAGGFSLAMLATFGVGIAFAVLIALLAGLFRFRFDAAFKLIVEDMIGGKASRLLEKALFRGPALGALLWFVGVTAASVILLATALHFAALIWIQIERVIPLLQASLGGNYFDTLNAALGFAALYHPFLVALLLAIATLTKRALRRQKENTAEKLLKYSPIIMTLPIFVHFPLALSGAHPNTSYFQALSAIFGGLLVIILVALPFGLLGKRTR